MGEFFLGRWGKPVTSYAGVRVTFLSLVLYVTFVISSSITTAWDLFYVRTHHRSIQVKILVPSPAALRSASAVWLISSRPYSNRLSLQNNIVFFPCVVAQLISLFTWGGSLQHHRSTKTGVKPKNQSFCFRWFVMLWRLPRGFTGEPSTSFSPIILSLPLTDVLFDCCCMIFSPQHCKISVPSLSPLIL